MRFRLLCGYVEGGEKVHGDSSNFYYKKSPALRGFCQVTD